MNEVTTPLTIDGGLAAVLTAPRGRASFPAVLMMHGFASQKDEVGALFARLAERLAWRAVGSLRFDFRGFGDSAGRSEDSSLHGMLDDAGLALRVLRTTPGVDAERIALLGFSLGGVIAARLAEIESDATPLMLWSTPRTAVSIGDDLTPDERAVLLAEGSVELDLGWRTLRIGRALVDSLRAFDVVRSLSGHTGTLFAAAGSEDPLVDELGPFDAALLAGRHRELRVFEGADHTFGEAAGDHHLGDELLSWTAERLAASLCD